MPDREKVINGLQHCIGGRGCYECPYTDCDSCTPFYKEQIMRESLELLKAQEYATEQPKRIDLQEETKAWLDEMDAVEALGNIADICQDWDGYRTANGLGGLINEIWAYARYCADRLLKSQEPQVMSLEEALNCLVIEYRSGKLQEVGKHVFTEGFEYYGDLWRVWDRMPTDEQREAIPWRQ